MFKRTSNGRFSSFKSWVRGLVIKTLQFALFSLVIVSAVFALSMYIKYKKGNYEVRASQTVEVEAVKPVENFSTRTMEYIKSETKRRFETRESQDALKLRLERAEREHYESIERSVYEDINKFTSTSY